MVHSWRTLYTYPRDYQLKLRWYFNQHFLFSGLKDGHCRQTLVIRLSLSFFLSLFPDRNLAPPHKWLCHSPSFADASSVVKHYRVIMVSDAPWVVKGKHTPAWRSGERSHMITPEKSLSLLVSNWYALRESIFFYYDWVIN